MARRGISHPSVNIAAHARDAGSTSKHGTAQEAPQFKHSPVHAHERGLKKKGRY